MGKTDRALRAAKTSLGSRYVTAKGRSPASAWSALILSSANPTEAEIDMAKRACARVSDHNLPPQMAGTGSSSGASTPQKRACGDVGASGGSPVVAKRGEASMSSPGTPFVGYGARLGGTKARRTPAATRAGTAALNRSGIVAESDPDSSE